MKEESSKKTKLIHTLIENVVIILGLSLMALYALTSNTDYLIYSSIISLLIIGLATFLFFLGGLQYGFQVYMEFDAEVDFSILIMFCLFIGINILLLILNAF